MLQDKEALMSATSLGMPTPNRSGEDLEFDQFVANMTPEKIKALAIDLANLRKGKKDMADDETT